MLNRERQLQRLPVALFIVVFIILPMTRIGWFSMMPGDIGDARLNNYFLENIYQFISGRSDSLWHLGFFSPFPYVLGFSDNLFGSAPFYLLPRFLTGQSDTAYQIWFLFGYVANFAAAYYALRRLRLSQLASSIGALVFAFALPTTDHAGHAQLHYRFGIPLSITFLLIFLERKEWRFLSVSGVWLVWQFYCGIYMGFFTLLLLSILTMLYFLSDWRANNNFFRQSVQDFRTQWSSQTNHEKSLVLISFFLLPVSLLLLFYPYLQVSHLYGAKRSWDEIAMMLPRLQSYFIADTSWLWSSTSKIFSGVPMRHEHQMFIGAIPMLLALLGFLLGSRKENGSEFALLSGMLGFVIALTLYFFGASFWYLLHWLPLASAIRAMTRLDQALLFPVAYLAGVAVDQLRARRRWGTRLVEAVILPLMIFEFSATSMHTSAKDIWRERLVASQAVIPGHLPEDAVVFFAQRGGPFFADELDAMWVSLKYGVKTLNGYSGLLPPGLALEYGNDCAELPRRVLSYLRFRGQGTDMDAYRELMKRMIPVGFIGCEQEWFTTLPNISKVDREYSADEIRNITCRFERKRRINGQSLVELKISNLGNLLIAAQSGLGKPMRISWRFLDASGNPVSGWDTRKDLAFDIPAQGNLKIQIAIDQKMEIKGGALQVSLVQEGVFWAHDIGIQPLTIPWE